MEKPRQIKTIVTVLLSTAFATKLFGADPTPAGTPKVYPESRGSTSAGGPGLSFRKSPRPPFPLWLKREVLATRNMKNNAIVSVAIDHGKIVRVVPSGGNEALSEYLAQAVQKTWVADPRMDGTFTLPIKFAFKNRY